MNSDDGSLGRNRRPPDPTALMQEVEWNMASKRTLTVVAGVGAAALAIAGVAIAQNHEANENRIIGKHSERDIPLAQVPEAAMNAARAQLASIRPQCIIGTRIYGRQSCAARNGYFRSLSTPSSAHSHAKS